MSKVSGQTFHSQQPGATTVFQELLVRIQVKMGSKCNLVTCNFQPQNNREGNKVPIFNYLSAETIEYLLKLYYSPVNLQQDSVFIFAAIFICLGNVLFSSGLLEEVRQGRAVC
jgi:hypothetical protein